MKKNKEIRVFSMVGDRNTENEIFAQFLEENPDIKTNCAAGRHLTDEDLRRFKEWISRNKEIQNARARHRRATR